MRVGFIGLGAMGQAMVANLLAAGHDVTVWSRQPGPAAAMRVLGAEVVSRARDAFVGDAMISMLSDDDAVRQVILDGGVLPAGGSRTVHVNMATVSVAFAQELAAIHRAAGIAYVSAPVFGRADLATTGQLNILAAGDAAAIGTVQPLFDAVGQRTWRLGPDPSQSAIVKIGGNFMVACVIEAFGEAMALCQANGVAPAAFVDVLTDSIFDVPIYKAYGRLIADARFEPVGFRLVLGLKDVHLALAAGDAAHVPLPLASLLRDGFLDAIAHGDGEKDWSALAKVAGRRAGLDKRSSVQS